MSFIISSWQDQDDRVECQEKKDHKDRILIYGYQEYISS